MGERGRDAARRRRAALRQFWRVSLILAVAAAACAATVLLLRAAGASSKVQTVAAVVVAAGALAVAIARVFTETTEPLGMFATAVAIALAVVGGLSYLGVIEAEPAVGCLNSTGDIQATAANDKTIVYSQATALSDPKGLVVTGCALRFTGYCIGAVHGDATQGPDTLDARWLILDGGQGLIASGDTVGSVPPERRPSKCPRGLAPPKRPASVTATIDGKNQMVRLGAHTEHAAYIGYAIELRAGVWRRLGWDREPEDDAPVDLPLPTGTGTGTGTGARIAALACVGVQRPFDEPVIASSSPGRVPRPADLPSVSQPEYGDPRKTACDAGLPQPGGG